MVLHLSVDDVLDVLLRAAEDGNADPFRQPELAFLRALHRRTGAVFGLYLFAETDAGRIEDVPDRFAPAFARSAAWLRFGFHGRDAATSYGIGGVTAASARLDHDRIRAQARRFAGPAAWDRMPRVHRFLGREEVVRAWRDAPEGPVGLLTPDDDRLEAYALPDAARAALRAHGTWTDPRDGTAYAASLPRLETDPDPVATTASWLEQRSGNRSPPVACAFTHEPFLRDRRVRARLRALSAWARRSGLRFGRPEEAVVQSSDEDDSAS